MPGFNIRKYNDINFDLIDEVKKSHKNTIEAYVAGHVNAVPEDPSDFCLPKP